MKQKIHPNWHDDCKVTCACGNTFTTGSTQKEIKVEVCAACHPFFTGEMKYVDTMGRVEKFKKKQKAAAVKNKKSKKKADKSSSAKTSDDKATDEDEQRPETLKEMIKREMKKKAK